MEHLLISDDGAPVAVALESRNEDHEEVRLVVLPVLPPALEVVAEDDDDDDDSLPLLLDDWEDEIEEAEDNHVMWFGALLMLRRLVVEMGLVLQEPRDEGEHFLDSFWWRRQPSTTKTCSSPSSFQNDSNRRWMAVIQKWFQMAWDLIGVMQ